MQDTCSLTDIDEFIDTLLEMMKDHEDHLYGVIDIVAQVQDEIKHLISQDNEPDE
jgi:DNA-directed RNA polymerase subunit F